MVVVMIPSGSPQWKHLSGKPREVVPTVVMGSTEYQLSADGHVGEVVHALAKEHAGEREGEHVAKDVFQGVRIFGGGADRLGVGVVQFVNINMNCHSLISFSTMNASTLGHIH
ncbi:hypothetical protein FGO68_gene13430 [Halteria grandinella]|uniref:Uncharacterized protein n=1 Tax=Halteria grandinella TaxID=5974 RepID=A0A8J8T0R5_HALGN|nr:hypothetical protein FGO68_gene13430 [Halteria grandinella]